MLVMERDFAGRQIPGARPYQEDAQGFAALQEDSDGNVLTLLVVLADGMGGENAGDFASHCVVDTFVQFCHDYMEKKESDEGGDEQDSESRQVDDIPDMLRAAMNASNAALDAAIDNNIELDGMGSTLLAAVVTENSLHWLSVGDSPLFLYRDGEIAQVNEDHSMMPLLLDEVAAGTLSEAELAVHPDRNVLRAAMTGGSVDLVDCPSASFPLQPADILIVASDGIQTLDDESIKVRLDRHYSLPADGITQKLLKAVEREKRPRQDNASINTICIPDPAKQAMQCEELMSKTRLIRRA